MARTVTATGMHTGFPSVAQDYFSGDFSFDANVITNPDTTFIVRVSGTGMEDAHIFHDDLLIVDRSLTASSGDIVIAIINDEFTVKQLTTNAHHQPILTSRNPSVPDVQLYFDDDIILWGVVIGNYHPLIPTVPYARHHHE